MVRLLPPKKSEIIYDPKQSFNPTMVRLLQTTKSAALTVRSSFNPTMVRLLRKEAQKKGCVEVMFQSHNGAIAA
mgnify:CR=1 FL=1